jgi:hypothetical protein
MRTRALVSLGLGLLLVLGSVPTADAQTVWAKPRDLRVLADELRSLDATLEQLDRARTRADYAEFKSRADRLRTNVEAMRDDMADDDRNVALEDVSRLRSEIVDLRLDIESALDMRYTGVPPSLPAGTQIMIRLDQSISSKTARPEDRITATVAEPVRLDGRVVIPVGTEVHGVVRDVSTADRLSRGGKLQLSFDNMRLDSRRLDMRTRVVSMGEGMDKSEAQKKAGLGALLGGVLGGITSGREGVVIGAILGAGGGVAASKGEDVSLPEGTIMTLSLDEALTVSTTR